MQVYVYIVAYLKQL